ncbi:hypothetical protein B566_EDAN017202 [Ephemera danica]|nr:hypothetical protein B566_EDAN017202 [Ephemera danica]
MQEVYLWILVVTTYIGVVWTEVMNMDVLQEFVVFTNTVAQMVNASLVKMFAMNTMSVAIPATKYTVPTLQKKVCPRNEFYCDNGMCVPMSAKCDGINHCGDGSDEWGCPKPPDVPPCQTSPAGLNCGADEFVPHNESRICSCSNTCRRVEITCLTNGKPLQKCSNTVATCFTNGKYKFKCANGFKQISGNSTVVCDNAGVTKTADTE